MSVALLCSAVCPAEEFSRGGLRLGSPFGENAVVQRDMPLPVWGWGRPGEEVTVAFGEATASTYADGSGYFRAVLPPLPAASTGRILSVTASSGSAVVCQNVRVGEVWLCAGQSNMEWPLGNLDDDHAREVSRQLKERPIHCLKVEHNVALEPQQRANMVWLTPERADDWSGVGAGFAHFLHQQLGDVPVGIIQVSWGSAFIEGFLPLDLMGDLPPFRERMERFFAGELAEVKELTSKPWPRDGNARANIRLRQKPNILYNGMLHPLLGYPLRGVVWYQGEANACARHSTVADVLAYEASLKAFVGMLRERFHNPELFALVVPLPGFRTIYAKPAHIDESAWYGHPGVPSLALMREVQRKVRDLPHTAVPVTADTGELNNIHPQQKMAICERLSLLAARHVYDAEVVASGPVYSGLAVSNGEATITFANGVGMKTLDGEAPKGFWVAGDDRLWHRADACIKGEAIILTSQAVEKPVAVRYAYAAKPDVNLVGATGLPAEPFRTDDWRN